jgi:hypothetical protein
MISTLSKSVLAATKFMSAVEKTFVIGLITASLSACSTTNQKSVESWQGKVWRGVVSKTLVDTTDWRPTDKDWIASTKFDDTRDIGMRMARVHFASGWNSVIANAMVPDNIEFQDIPKGTLVDVMAETGPDMDYSGQRYTRIVRVVCAVSDDNCMLREKDAKTYGAIIDSAPRDVNNHYGVTYTRRESKADVKKYD